MDKRRMCPNCRAFITTDDKICPYCQVQLGRRIVDTSTSDAVGIPADNFVTMIVLIINTGLFVLTAMRSSGGFMGIDSRTLVEFGAKYGPLIFGAGQWWRLVTAGFLHGGLLHIAMNSYALFMLGPISERLFGASRFIVIYFTAIVVGFMASAWALPMTPSIGASGGITGLIGALLGLGYREKSHVVNTFRSALIQNTILMIVIGFLPGIDNYAHGGGFAAGFVVAYLAGSPTRNSSVEGLWKILSLVALAIVAFSFVEMYLAFGSYNF